MADSDYYGTPCSLAMYHLCPLAAEAVDAPFVASGWERGYYDETQGKEEENRK